MSARDKINVWPIEEAGFLVRGTRDELRARAEVYAYLRENGEDPIGSTLEALGCRDVEPGLYRVNPCHCGEEHRFDMGYAKRPGRGVFPGVLLSW